MKKILLFLTLSVFLTLSLYANPKIFKEHKPRLRDGASVVTGCAYCHNKETGLEKKKGQDYKKIQKAPTCAGKGCH